MPAKAITPRIYENMKFLRVACAIIEHDGKVLAAQRSDRMSLPLKWEFPGGKINEGESVEECLKRELMEELGIAVMIHEAYPVATYSYPTFMVTLYPLRCTIASGEIVLHEHKAVAWMLPDELQRLDWADADWPIIDTYVKRRGETTDL
jgi:8-oxo-dGTP diphosphatase